MIIFLYGQDTYRSHQKLEEIVEHYRKTHKSCLSLSYFDGDNFSFQEFKNQIETRSIFREKKLVVLKDVFENKEFQEEFLKQGKKIADSDNVVLIYERKELGKDSPLSRFLKKKSKFQEFQPLKDQGLKNWVKKELKDYQASYKKKTDSEQIKIEREALEKLVSFVGNNLWRMSNEVKKLVNYKNGKVIEVKDVELLVKPEIEVDIFKTIDAMALKDKKRALKLLHGHLGKGDAPLYLLAMINFQLRNLLTIKSGARLNAHPYVVKKTIQQARNFSLSELKKTYQKIFQVDLGIKTGKIEPEAALDLLIAEI